MYDNGYNVVGHNIMNVITNEHIKLFISLIVKRVFA